eukprot:4416316-Prymnesium_polylepis.1
MLSGYVTKWPREPKQVLFSQQTAQRAQQARASTHVRKRGWTRTQFQALTSRETLRTAFRVVRNDAGNSWILV